MPDSPETAHNAEAPQEAPAASPTAPSPAPLEVPDAPAAPSRATIVGRSIGAAIVGLAPRYGRAAVEALVTYAAAWILGLIVTVIIFVPSQTAANGEWFVEYPGQLVGLGVFGLLNGGTTILGVSISATAAFLPLVMTAAVVIGSVILARRNERALATTTTQRWILSIANSIVFAILTLLIALVLPIVSTSAAVANPLLPIPPISVALSTASFTLVIGSIVVVACGSLLGRTSIARSRVAPQAVGPVGRIIAATAPVAVLYAVVVGVLIAVVVVIVVIAQGAASTLLSVLLWLPLVVADGISLVDLSTVGLTGSGVPLLSSLGQFPTSVWLPSSTVPIWAACVAVVVNLVVIALIGIALRLRRRDRATGATWATTILVFAVLGVVVTVVGGVSAWTHVDASALGATLGTGSSGVGGGLGGLGGAAIGSIGSIQLTFGPALWTFLAFAIVGAMVETSASFLAPAVIPAFPAGTLSATSRFFARFGVPLVAADKSGDGTSTAVGTAASIPVEPPAPMSAAGKRRLKVGLIIGGAVVVLVVLVSVAVGILGTSVFGPDRQVRAYLDDVVAGHAALALADGHVSVHGSTTSLLTDEVLAKTRSRVRSYSLTSTVTSGAAATVIVNETQGAHATQVRYTVHKAGTEFLFFTDWKLDPVPLQTISVQVSPGVKALAVNGTTVAVSRAQQANGFVEVPAFPGAYSVGLGGGDKWFTAKSRSTLVEVGSAGEANDVSIDAKPSTALKREVASQVTTFLAKCAAQTSIAPAGCPFEYFGFGTVSHVVWKVTEAPSLSLDSGDGTSWNVTSEGGQATVTFDDNFFGETDHENDSTEFYVDGTVSFATGQPVFTYGEGF